MWILGLKGSNAVLHHQLKHQEESWKYDAQWSIFDELQGVSSGDETPLSNLSVISNKRILDGEIEDVTMSSFLSDFLSIFFMNYLWLWELLILNQGSKHHNKLNSLERRGYIRMSFFVYWWTGEELIRSNLR